MYCSTCGASVANGRSACDTCGAPLRQVLTNPSNAQAHPADVRWTIQHNAGVCSRCGYRGEGISYFSRGRNVAGLVGLTLITAGAMGVGGLIYYVVRKDHKLCPRCGNDWGAHGEYALTTMNGRTPALQATPAGSSARAGSILFFALAAFLLIIGVGEAEIVALMFGLAAGGAGYALHRVAKNSKAARRAAHLSSQQLPVLQLASRRSGKLTVTDVAAELGWTIARAEKVLDSLDDGVRVSSEVTDDGIIVFEFRELMHAPDRFPNPSPPIR